MTIKARLGFVNIILDFQHNSCVEALALRTFLITLRCKLHVKAERMVVLTYTQEDQDWDTTGLQQ